MSAYNRTVLQKYNFDEDVATDFPLIIDDTTLAFNLHIRTKTLWYLINMRNKGTAYKCFAIPQFDSDGNLKKMREIQEPNGHMKTVHSLINRMLSKMSTDESISAYVKHRNCADAARKHVRMSYTFDTTGDMLHTSTQHPDVVARSHPDPSERYLADAEEFTRIEELADPQDPSKGKVIRYHQPLCMIKLDLKNFFPSIKASWIREYFMEVAGYSHYVSSMIASLCTVKRTVIPRNKASHVTRHLPQGSPLSGSMANIIGYHRFGRKIKELLAKDSPDWVYTIYSDDIIMTHPSNTITREHADEIRDAVIKIVEDAKFKINGKKTMIRRSTTKRIKILGCIVSDKLNVPKQVKNSMACTLHNCLENGFESQCKESQTVEGLIMKLRGTIEYIRSIRPDIGDAFKSKLFAAMEAHTIEVTPVTKSGTLW